MWLNLINKKVGEILSEYGIYMVYSALFVCNAIFPHVYYLYIGIWEKYSNLDSNVETKVIETVVLLKEFDNGRHS